MAESVSGPPALSGCATGSSIPPPRSPKARDRGHPQLDKLRCETRATRQRPWPLPADRHLLYGDLTTAASLSGTTYTKRARLLEAVESVGERFSTAEAEDPCLAGSITLRTAPFPPCRQR